MEDNREMENVTDRPLSEIEVRKAMGSIEALLDFAKDRPRAVCQMLDQQIQAGKAHDNATAAYWCMGMLQALSAAMSLASRDSDALVILRELMERAIRPQLQQIGHIRPMDLIGPKRPWGRA